MTLPPQRIWTAEDLEKSQATRAAKRAEWARLTLRQKWADDGFMRAHLVVADVRIGSDKEPASVPRMRTLLRRAGIHEAHVKEAVGCNLARFLTLNPNLPLWAAVALVLESDGRFTDEVLKRRAGIDDRIALAA